MIVAPIPPNEEARLRALDEYQLIDMLPNESCDAITKIAAEVCDTPIALINIIGKDLQYTKSKYGTDVDLTPRSDSFCGHAICHPNEVMVVPDARQDVRFHDNPATTNTPPVVFYAGVPLKDEQGNALGTLCIVDHKPGELSVSKREALQSLANLVQQQFQSRKVQLQLKHALEGQNAARVLVQKLENAVDRLDNNGAEAAKMSLQQTVASLSSLLKN